jgi:hypothetical protein
LGFALYRVSLSWRRADCDSPRLFDNGFARRCVKTPALTFALRGHDLAVAAARRRAAGSDESSKRGDCDYDSENELLGRQPIHCCLSSFVQNAVAMNVLAASNIVQEG